MPYLDGRLVTGSKIPAVLSITFSSNLTAIQNCRCNKNIFSFPRAMSQAAALVRIFGECREGQIPRPLGRKEQVRSCPVACCGVFDFCIPNPCALPKLLFLRVILSSCLLIQSITHLPARNNYFPISQIISPNSANTIKKQK